MKLDIPARFEVGNDLWCYVEVGDRRMPLCQIAESDVITLRAAHERAERKFAEAQIGAEPGPGALYPEGSQQGAK